MSQLKKHGAHANTQRQVYHIHHMMTVLLVFKTLSMLFESIRYHYLGLTGAAEAWSIVYYLFAFLKGITLFVVVLLIGSGWSLIKPFLHSRDKRIIVLVLSLQVGMRIAAWQGVGAGFTRPFIHCWVQSRSARAACGSAGCASGLRCGGSRVVQSGLIPGTRIVRMFLVGRPYYASWRKVRLPLSCESAVYSLVNLRDSDG